MKNNIYKYGLLAIMWMVYTLPALAGPIDPPTDDDPDPVPVDEWLPYLFSIGLLVGLFYKIIKEAKVLKDN